MTTFNDDYIQLELPDGRRRLFCSHVGLTWPPPEKLWVDDFGVRIANDDDDPAGVLERKSFSMITDEQRSRMTHVARGALYEYATAPANA